VANPEMPTLSEDELDNVAGDEDWRPVDGDQST